MPKASRATASVFEAGEAYVVPPGHTPKILAGTEIVEFSPSEKFARTLAQVTKNLEESEATG